MLDRADGPISDDILEKCRKMAPKLYFRAVKTLLKCEKKSCVARSFRAEIIDGEVHQP